MSNSQRAKNLTPEQKHSHLFSLYTNAFDYIKKYAKKDNKHQEIKQSILLLKDPQKNFSTNEQILKFSKQLVSPLDNPSNKVQEKIIACLEDIILNNLLDQSILQEMVITFLTYIKNYRNFSEDTINFKVLNLCINIYSCDNLFIHADYVKYLVKNCLLIYLSNKSKEFQDSARLTLKQIIEHMVKKINIIYSQTIASSNAIPNKGIAHNENIYFARQYINLFIDMIEFANLKNVNSDQNINDNNNNSENNNNNENIIREYLSILKNNSGKENVKTLLENLNLSQYKILNENESPIGKYGWCVNCRNTANYFSLKINFPVCSLDSRVSECELDVSRLLTSIDNENKFEQNFFRKDYIIILKYLAKTSITENSDNNDPEFVHSKCRIFCLDAIREMIDKGSAYFINDFEVISIIKDDLMGSLVKNTLSSDINILKNSIKLFLIIVKKFREHLKDQMAIFIKKILIAILESENFSIEYKEVVLDALLNLSDDSTFLVEIYVNYDCDVNYSTVFYDIINIMSKIIYGLYKKQKFANTLKPLEEKKLRLKCLDFLNKFIQNLSNLVEKNCNLDNNINNNNSNSISTNCTAIANNNNYNNNNNKNNPEESAFPELEESHALSELNNIEEIKDKINQNLKNKEKLKKAITKFNIYSPSNCFNFLTKQGMIKDEEYFNLTKKKYLDNLTSTSKHNFKAISDINNANLFDEIISNEQQIPEINIMKTTFLTDINSLIYLFNTLERQQIINLTYEDFTAFEMARFIRSNIKDLNRDNVGEYLCKGKDFNIKVVQYFIDSFDFKELPILEALRSLFTELPLQGEGQIIDRIVQIFGQRYHKENPNILKNPDLSYYIAFSIIMLNTDLHRDEVEKKMTLKEYINRVISMCPNDNVDEKYLSDVYYSVLNNPLVIPGQKISTGVKNKRELIKLEKENILKNAINKMKDLAISNNNYIKEIDNDTIKNLINSTWSYFLGIFSQLLADFEDEKIDTTCIENILKMAGICCILDLDHFAEAYINTIINCTNLMEGREITQKNLQCIAALINFIMLNGQYIRTCWYNLLNVISKIDFYYSQLTNKEIFIREIKQHSKLKNPEKEVEIELKNFEILKKTKFDVAAENIFSKTAKFEEKALMNFVENLCKISSYELERYYNPRVFSLHKLVEVADFNIFRIQVEWVKIWKMISEHLVSVITNSQQQEIIWSEALDSLRQTIWKLLKKEDLSIFNFQMDFFKPFEIIFSKTVKAPNRAEMVLNYIYHTVCSYSSNIHSGWIIIFNILKSGLKRKNDKMNIIIKNTLEKIADDSSIFTNQEVFKGYIECLSHMYFEETLKEYSFNTILNLVNKIIKAYEQKEENKNNYNNNNIDGKNSNKNVDKNNNNNNKENNEYNNEKKFKLLKLFLYGFDDLFTIDLIEHFNLLFEIISHNKDFIFSNESNAFAYIYFSFFKPHFCILLLNYLGSNIIYTQKYKEDKILKNYKINDCSKDDIFINIKLFLEYSLNLEILRINKKIDDNYPVLIKDNNDENNNNKMIDMLNELKKSNNNEADLIAKKIKLFQKFDIKNLEIALDVFLEKMDNLPSLINNEKKIINYNYFTEDIIITILFLTMFSKCPETLFKVLQKILTVLKMKFSQNFWKKFLEVNNYIFLILSTLNTKIENNNHIDDLIEFNFSFFKFQVFLFNNFISNLLQKYDNNLLSYNKLLSKIKYILLQIDLENNFKNYNISKSPKIIDTLISIQQIQSLIIKENKDIKELFDENIILSLRSLSFIFSKYNLAQDFEDNNLTKVIHFDLNALIPKFLKLLNKQQLEITFKSLLDFIDSNNNQIKFSAKHLLSQFLNQNLCLFVPYNESEHINNNTEEEVFEDINKSDKKDSDKNDDNKDKSN